MLLVVDIGNTHIVVGVYRHTELLYHWRIATRIERTGDEYGIYIANFFQMSHIALTEVQHAIIAGVVPPVQAAIIRAIRRYFSIVPMVVGPELKIGIDIRYNHPKDVGADRIVNAVAAYDRFHQPCIVVDFGTATTFDLVGPDGAYLGGAIAPGIGISAESLFEKTAKLPRIEVVRPHTIIGKDTIASMQSGLYWGYVALVDGLITRIMTESQFPVVHVLATGGLARMLAHDSQQIECVDEFLTLTGLRLLFERNR